VVLNEGDGVSLEVRDALCPCETDAVGDGLTLSLGSVNTEGTCDNDADDDGDPVSEPVDVGVGVEVGDDVTDALCVGVIEEERETLDVLDADAPTLCVCEGVRVTDRDRLDVDDGVDDGLAVGDAVELDVGVALLDADAVELCVTPLAVVDALAPTDRVVDGVADSDALSVSVDDGVDVDDGVGLCVPEDVCVCDVVGAALGLGVIDDEGVG